ncbi:MAG: lycopene cyclase family protein, partial [Bacteroidota bacterium]
MISVKYAIVGGGLAGLSLAFRLKKAGIAGQDVLLIDPEKRIENDRTWCFFDDKPSPFDHLVRKTWNKVAVQKGHRKRIQGTYNRPYKMLFAQDFFEFVWAELDSWAGFQFYPSPVNSIQDSNKGLLILADDINVQADYVFDSRPGPLKVDPTHPILYQHFKGLFIKTLHPVFDDQTATLMDFQSLG